MIATTCPFAVRLAATGLLVGYSILAAPAARGAAPDNLQPELAPFIARFEAAALAMFGGDASSWKALLSESEQGSLFTPFGGVVLGREGTRKRYEAVAARTEPSEAEFEVEVLRSGVSGDLAYIVAFERSRFGAPGTETVRTGFTRVTLILRRENDEWRLLHRHMDHLPEELVPL